MLLHIETLFCFYGAGTAQDTFRLYQGRKRAADNMVNMLLDGTTKYNENLRTKKRDTRKKNKNNEAIVRKRRKKVQKIAKTAEEDEQKKKDKEAKGKAKDPTRIKWKPKPFEVGDKKKVPLVVFGNGMFGKDSIHLRGHKCETVGVLWRAIKRREAVEDLLAITIDEFKTSRICSCCSEDSLEKLHGVPTHSILVCKTCKILWNRDVNASKNMMKISLSIWKKGGRPAAFTRSKKEDAEK